MSEPLRWFDFPVQCGAAGALIWGSTPGGGGGSWHAAQDFQAEGLIHTSPGRRPGFIVQLLSGCRPTACFIAKDESRLQRSWGFGRMNPGRCPGLV